MARPFVLGLVLCGLAPVFAAEPESGGLLGAIQQEVSAVLGRCREAVVKIEATDHHGRLSGTGFFIDPNGTLYTSFTVGGECRDIVVHFGGERFPATRLLSDLRSGIALLKIDAKTPFLSFGKSRELAMASPVIAIGFPMDLPLTPSFGTVGGFDLKHMGRYFATTHIRANIAVQQGEGGAPLLNLKGEVVGILISRLDAGSASFVLPIEAAEKVRRDFVRFCEVRPGWIGLQVRGVEKAVAGSTARVEEIIADGPAAKAGLQVGDFLLQVGERKISSPEELLDASFFATAEDDLFIRIARGEEELEFTVQAADPPNTTRARIPALGSTGETAAPLWKIDSRKTLWIMSAENHG